HNIWLRRDKGVSSSWPDLQEGYHLSCHAPESPLPQLLDTPIRYSFASRTSVGLNTASTSDPTCSSRSRIERVVITEVMMPTGVSTSTSDRTGPGTISLILPLI